MLRFRAHFIRLFHDALRAVAQSANAGIAARTMWARAEQQRAWASRTIEATRAAVARSRAILRRCSLLPQPLSGGAGDAFHEEIRARLAARTLPRIDANASAEDGSGTYHCVCCDRTIARWHPQYAPTLAPRLYAHAHCFLVWVAESMSVKWEGDKADSI